VAAPPPSAPPQQQDRGLDSHWDRRLKSGTLQPELTLDLHGHNLDGAYDRLMSGVSQARAMGVRTILLITGKSRPVAAADRGSRRGAIRAKVLDWLAASSHHSAIAAVRRAHQKHGGDGALYIVLKRER
jgi:DNA-nicking Smr family endonuclease